MPLYLIRPQETFVAKSLDHVSRKLASVERQAQIEEVIALQQTDSILINNVQTNRAESYLALVHYQNTNKQIRMLLHGHSNVQGFSPLHRMLHPSSLMHQLQRTDVAVVLH